MNFMQYLNENSTVKQILAEEQFIKLAEENCSKAIDGLRKGNMIFRGAYYEGKFNYIDNSKNTRKSANTKNYYTIIFDEIFKKQNLPLRSKSTICTTQYSYADSFGQVFVLLPFDNCKFGVVGKDDMWSVQINMGGGDTNIEYINSRYDYLSLDDSSFENFCNSIHELISDSPDTTKEDFDDYLSIKGHSIPSINYVLWYIVKNYGRDIEDIKRFMFEKYDPSKLGFKFPKDIYAEFPKGNMELWFEGEFLAIDYNVIDKAYRLLGIDPPEI